jgi:N-methylhydantoinase B/oxoprolinase/acetone carboxylase alpha subunit
MVKPWGVNGGKPGSRSRKIMYRNNSYGTSKEMENMEVVQSKMDYLHVYPGKSPDPPYLPCPLFFYHNLKGIC